MISKEKFVDIINRLRNYDDMQKEISEIQHKYIEPRENDFCNIASVCVGHETVVVDLLEDIFKDENEMIGYWLWELDYGRRFKKGFVIDENGIDIDLSSADKLYDYLIESII